MAEERFVMIHLLEKYKLQLFFSIIFVILLNLMVKDFIIDDAYISFRYAYNFLKSQTLYYNLGESGPFGYTNPLYIILLSIFNIFTYNYELSFLIISRLITSILTFFIYFYILTLLKGENIYKTIFNYISFFFVIFMFPFFLPNAFSGLETFTLSFLILLLLILHFNDFINENYENALYINVIIGIILMIRFDSFVVISPILLYRIIDLIIKNKYRQLSSLMITFVLVFGFYLIHWLYTGYLLPLSYIQKKTGHSLCILNLKSIQEYLIFSVSALSFNFLYLLYNRKFFIVVFLSLLLIINILFYQYFWVWHFFRYLFPVVFAIFIFTLIEIININGNKKTLISFMIVIYSFIFFNPYFENSFKWVSGCRAGTRYQLLLAKIMKDSNIKDRIFATCDAGLMAYISKWRIIDFAGLTTNEVYSFKNIDIIKNKKPSVIIWLHNKYNDDVKNVKLRNWYLGGESPFPNNYKFIKTVKLSNEYWWNSSEYCYYIFTRDDISDVINEKIKNLDVDIITQLGFQKHVFELIKNIPKFWNYKKDY